jgi:hypothetical protein
LLLLVLMPVPLLRFLLLVLHLLLVARARALGWFEEGCCQQQVSWLHIKVGHTRLPAGVQHGKGLQS